jgi:hypothetical protein
MKFESSMFDNKNDEFSEEKKKISRNFVAIQPLYIYGVNEAAFCRTELSEWPLISAMYSSPLCYDRNYRICAQL